MLKFAYVLRQHHSSVPSNTGADDPLVKCVRLSPPRVDVRPVLIECFVELLYWSLSTVRKMYAKCTRKYTSHGVLFNFGAACL